MRIKPNRKRPDPGTMATLVERSAFKGKRDTQSKTRGFWRPPSKRPLFRPLVVSR